MRYTESELSSELLDVPSDGCPTHKVLICTSPRSGSFLLCRKMIGCGLGIPHEYFNAIHVKDIGVRFGIIDLALPQRMKDDLKLLERYTDMLAAERTANGVLAIKLQFWQYDMFLDNPVGDKFLQNAWFVHLYRSDVLGQAISLHFARLTGKWGFDDSITTTPAASPNFFNFNAIDQEIEGILGEDHNWRRFFAKNGITPFEIAYEELCSAPTKLLRSLSAWIGVQDQKLSWDSPDEKRYMQIPSEIATKADVREQYLRSKRRIVPAFA
jgi:LPS sulfotransferase NodH